MNKLIKLGKSIVVTFDNGTSRVMRNATNEDIAYINEHLQDTEALVCYFNPEIKKQKEEASKVESFINEAKNSGILKCEDDSITWPEVSPLSMPKELVEAVVECIKTNNTKALNAYKNFWTLLSLNPDDECRKNLLWFLNYHGLVLSSSGCFIAYRNANKTNRVDDEGNPVYTDAHSGSTSISIGHTVTIPRSKCDPDNHVMCSSGLHLGGAKWLEHNYCGDTGLVCICNPANVVSLPQESSYGKLRCCAYTPIDYAKYGEDEHIIPYDVEQGFECKYAAQTIYEGLLEYQSEEQKYIIKVPVVDNVIDSFAFTENLLNLAKECILRKNG